MFVRQLKLIKCLATAIAFIYILVICNVEITRMVHVFSHLINDMCSHQDSDNHHGHDHHFEDHIHQVGPSGTAELHHHPFIEFMETLDMGPKEDHNDMPLTTSLNLKFDNYFYDIQCFNMKNEYTLTTINSYIVSEKIINRFTDVPIPPPKRKMSSPGIHL